MNEKEIAFIKELEKLSKKYGISIAGCGCCGSPRLTEMSGKDFDDEAGYCNVDQLTYVSQEDIYDWEKYHKEIVK